MPKGKQEGISIRHINEKQDHAGQVSEAASLCECGAARVEEAMVKLCQKHPLVGLITAWTAYVNDEVDLSVGSAAVGVRPRQFLEWGSRVGQEAGDSVPVNLRDRATPDQNVLLGYLSRRQLDLLQRMVEADLLLPVDRTYTSGLWEDLRALQALKLVDGMTRNGVWYFQPTLGVAGD